MLNWPENLFFFRPFCKINQSVANDLEEQEQFEWWSYSICFFPWAAHAHIFLVMLIVFVFLYSAWIPEDKMYHYLPNRNKFMLNQRIPSGYKEAIEAVDDESKKKPQVCCLCLCVWMYVCVCVCVCVCVSLGLLSCVFQEYIIYHKWKGTNKVLILYQSHSVCTKSTYHSRHTPEMFTPF